MVVGVIVSVRCRDSDEFYVVPKKSQHRVHSSGLNINCLILLGGLTEWSASWGQEEREFH